MSAKYTILYRHSASDAVAEIHADTIRIARRLARAIVADGYRDATCAWVYRNTGLWAGQMVAQWANVGGHAEARTV